jgi:hypothetical protein
MFGFPRDRGAEEYERMRAAAENERQTALATATDQAAVRSAEITFYRSLIVAAESNGIQADTFRAALTELAK